MRQRFKQLRTIVKPASAVADRILRPPTGLTVLIYHRVGAGSGGEVDLDVPMFDDQMAELAATDRVVSLDDGIAFLGGADVGTEQPVVVTFDDGTPDVFEHALPVLERHGIPMTLYVATRFVDESLPFWADGDPTLSWATIADGLGSGLVDIGSHTHSHALLDRLDPSQIADELDRSIGLIEHHLGRRPAHFAYPKALPPSAPAATAVAERFASAALAGTRANPRGTDPQLLSRSPIQRSDAMRWFRHKVDGGLGTEDRIRAIVNRRRYADATS